MKKLIITLALAIMTSMAAFADQVKPQVMQRQMGGDTSEEEILELCNWFLSTPPTENWQLRQLVAAKIVIYALNTDKFTLEIGEWVGDLLDMSGKHKESEDLLAVYIAGEVMYCLEHDLKASNATSFARSMLGVMDAYSQLPEHPLQSLNKYLEMDTAARLAAFEALYNEKH